MRLYCNSIIVDRRPLVLCLAGVLVAVVPAVALYSPYDRGGVGFAVLVMQVIAGIVGLAIVGVGYYSYRTANLKPTIWVAVALSCLVVVGTVGAWIEMNVGLLVPIWTWALVLVASFLTATFFTVRFTAPQPE